MLYIYYVNKTLVAISEKKSDRKLRKDFDILINVILPIGLGTILYFLPVTDIIRNHLSDGLWAYSLTSVILIIWNRLYSLFWLTLTILSFLVFEIFQYFNIVKGTGDLVDVSMYLIFFSIALMVNNLFKLKFNNL